jgi:DNA mismatch endonuclease, patch repair protein
MRSPVRHARSRVPSTILRETLIVSEATTRTMRANRSRNNRMEVRFRKALWAAGLRGYRLNVQALPGKPDVLFQRAQVAVFLNGCYWHRCPYCEPPRPKTNSRYWEAKFVYNRRRDEENTRALRARGFLVLVLWECRLEKSLSSAIARVARGVSSRGSMRSSARAARRLAIEA